MLCMAFWWEEYSYIKVKTWSTFLLTCEGVVVHWRIFSWTFAIPCICYARDYQIFNSTYWYKIFFPLHHTLRPQRSRSSVVRWARRRQMMPQMLSYTRLRCLLTGILFSLSLSLSLSLSRSLHTHTHTHPTLPPPPPPRPPQSISHPMKL